MPKYTTQAKPSKEETAATLAINNRETSKEEFAKRLWAAMAERGWNQSTLARFAGLNRDAVSTYVRARSLPSPQALEALAGALGVRPESLMPNYFEAAHSRVEPTMELRDLPNDGDFMWIKINMRLPRKVALSLFMQAQEHRTPD